MLDGTAENTPLLLGAKELRKRQALIAFEGAFLAHRGQWRWMASPLLTMASGHLAIRLNYRAQPLLSVLQSMDDWDEWWDPEDDDDDANDADDDDPSGHARRERNKRKRLKREPLRGTSDGQSVNARTARIITRVDRPPNPFEHVRNVEWIAPAAPAEEASRSSTGPERSHREVNLVPNNEVNPSAPPAAEAADGAAPVHLALEAADDGISVHTARDYNPEPGDVTTTGSPVPDGSIESDGVIPGRPSSREDENEPNTANATSSTVAHSEPVAIVSSMPHAESSAAVVDDSLLVIEEDDRPSDRMETVLMVGGCDNSLDERLSTLAQRLR